MEEQSASRDKSSDSIATSEEFEDLGTAPRKEEPSNLDDKAVTTGANTTEANEPNEPSPEIEIRNNGNMADLQETLDEALNDEVGINSNGLDSTSHVFQYRSKILAFSFYSVDGLKIDDHDGSQSCAIFNRISYLGSATVNSAAKSFFCIKTCL